MRPSALLITDGCAGFTLDLTKQKGGLREMKNSLPPSGISVSSEKDTIYSVLLLDCQKAILALPPILVERHLSNPGKRKPGVFLFDVDALSPPLL
jgi:hypothetical protein